jgi:CHAD domain-containing protein
MPHRIGKYEDIGSALARLVTEDVAMARAELAGSGPPALRLYRVRQGLKRIRTVLRVLRPALGARADDVSHQLRDAGRLLAETRDPCAVAASARHLMAVAEADGVGLDRVVARLDRQLERHECGGIAFAEVDSLMAAVQTEVSAVEGNIDGVGLLARGIDRAYRRGRKAMQTAAFSLETPDLHAWRKAVNDLRHLIRIGRKRLPADITKRESQLKDLGDTLGLDQDHAMLAEQLALSPEGDPALMLQLSLIADHRLKLESKAFALGAKLYKKRPKKFRRRLSLT